ncbi:MAG TPA: lytic transglycosylase F [Marinilabiliales bacterium]|jgi:membrane-bound lytic murein transglycosylase F|nr:MAG: hypothetical protein A2W95_04500 [Bacteroidetes bacterium GWA2_40_14]OFX59549.1 MAG: hypothetical protein A2W84_09765 [Bacteroidetes bacterium GWC2_40_13]OFX75556.1 MAG: hypothetical protein A2W96_08700 [Bacteroidetes bacterium GWD2_40_43]OFX90726.1 MAG: hypothetical protein A2W97_03095 [Bacteroidetes bacterium GWE2_40_63]OFY22354.1 MAG: hypothetical protein A2W88_11660 [Bacteroidetes bacterium GWF2_40_13]OFZ24643.1 MAG: hypothetical protein A2437_03560 [Bacteroidetes bacterium RIFOXYC
MSKRKNWLGITVWMILIVVGLSSCNKPKVEPEPVYDLAEIRSKGKLVAVTDYNSSSYFIYNGTPMGYQYDMLQKLSRYLGVELEIVVENDLNKAIEKLQNNECDILAMGLTITQQRQKELAFTIPMGQTHQVLVQRKPKNWQVMANYTLDNFLLKNQLDLAGKTIHVINNSVYVQRLMHLSDEIGDTIHIVEEQDADVEQLIQKVSKGEIEFTVADENVALLNQTYYPNIDISTPISFPQNQAWAVNKNATELLKTVNGWLRMVLPSDYHAVIYNKYYNDPKAAKRSQSPYFSLNGGKISVYDKYIQKYSSQIGWDWRLLASMIYQESRFNPKVESWAGAYGLMQLMPNTAERFGASTKSSPETNIKAGVRFIQWLDNQLADSVPDANERVKFVLAAYNIGLGHVMDARRLAQANGRNPNVWEGQVGYFLKNKHNPKYFSRELVKFGTCRGELACDYVDDVLRRYQVYQSIIE